MKNSKYYIIGIIGTLLTFYHAILILGLENQKGIIMMSSGLFSLLGLLTLFGFKRARSLAIAFFLLSAISNLVINNSILTAILPALLGIILFMDRKQNV